MSMYEVKAGMLARAQAGHDKGKLYMIYSADDAYVYLVDGKNRTLGNPKKKKIKHVQVLGVITEEPEMNDASIKRKLKLFEKELGRI